MKLIHKHPIVMIVIGIVGISLSSILVRFSTAPSAVTAAWRLLWTVALMTPVVFGNAEVRKELMSCGKKTLLESCVSGLLLAVHFTLWFESLKHTSVASSTTIVCTEVIWVSIGYCLFMKGSLSSNAVAAIAVTLVGSVLIALSDSAFGAGSLYGDILALLAAVSVAGYTLLGRSVRKTTSTSVYTYVVYSACTVFLLILCVCQNNGLLNYGLSPISIGFFLAIFSTILGHSIFSWCLGYFSPSFVSASKLCEPVAAAAIALFLFGEVPTLMQLLGGVLILGGVLYYSRLESK